MPTIKVFTAGCTRTNFFLTKGEAIDSGYDVFGISEIEVESPVPLEGLAGADLVDHSLDTILNPYARRGILAGVYGIALPNGTSKYSLTPESGMRFSGYLEHMEDYKPVTLPIFAVFEKAEKGGFTRLKELRPDLYGFDRHGNVGKLYFIDRSCDQELLHCVVRVVGISQDYPNYGFLKIEKLNLSVPDEEVLARYIAALHDVSPNTSLKFMHSEMCGSYAVLEYDQHARVLAADPSGNCVEVFESSTVRPSHKSSVMNCFLSSRVTESCTVGDFLCQGYLGCDFEDLQNDLVCFDFVSGDTKVESLGSSIVTDLMRRAADDEIIEIYSLDNVKFVVYNTVRFVTLFRNFTPSEINDLIDSCNAINVDANNGVKNKIRSGKMRLGNLRLGR